MIGNQHIKCYWQNSTHSLHVLLPANASYSTCYYNNRGTHAGTHTRPWGQQTRPHKVGKDHSSKEVAGFWIVAFVFWIPSHSCAQEISESAVIFFFFNVGVHMTNFKVNEESLHPPAFPTPALSYLAKFRYLVNVYRQPSWKIQRNSKSLLKKYLVATEVIVITLNRFSHITTRGAKKIV